MRVRQRLMRARTLPIPPYAFAPDTLNRHVLDVDLSLNSLDETREHASGADFVEAIDTGGKQVSH